MIWYKVLNSAIIIACLVLVLWWIQMTWFNEVVNDCDYDYDSFIHSSFLFIHHRVLVRITLRDDDRHLLNYTWSRHWKQQMSLLSLRTVHTYVVYPMRSSRRVWYSGCHCFECFFPTHSTWSILTLSMNICVAIVWMAQIKSNMKIESVTWMNGIRFES